jgi:NADH-quinone oxidoreductase E subunit
MSGERPGADVPDPDLEAKVGRVVARYPEAKAALLPVLWLVQRTRGWVDLESEAWVAERLGLSPAHVHGVVTFYTMYKRRPMGRHHIQVCTTLSCMLRGSDDLVTHLTRRLGIKPGETTPDGRFSLVKVECLGSCGTAPMLQLNDDYHENLTIESLDRLLDGLS